MNRLEKIIANNKFVNLITTVFADTLIGKIYGYQIEYNPMKENKRERDANGRFVKSTEPKKQETKKSPCKSITPDVDKEIAELKKNVKILEIALFKLRAEHTELSEELLTRDDEFNTVISNQRAITMDIISQLNWFQRRKLRKILASYPDKIYGYYMEKNV